MSIATAPRDEAVTRFRSAAELHTQSPSLLVVDDTETTRETLAEMLEMMPAQVSQAADSGAALKLMGQKRFDAVISDYLMPGANGLDLLKLVKKVSPQTEFILVTGFANVRDAVTAMKRGAIDYLQKPINSDELFAVVEKALERKRMRTELEDLRRKVREKGRIDSIVTGSARMHAILELVQDVAPTDATILITGESGTGKELIAKALVANSLRKDAPFYTVNCAALTETLVESELFGHAKGAFTGAHADREGILGAADGGTVFLDEIGELPPTTQSKMLRFLETGEIQRVGATATKIVDVRVVTATNKVLLEEVKRGRFREDLYFRLNVVSIEIPPLRERREDIVLLSERFVEEMNEAHHCHVEGLSRTAKEFLSGYNWPGNVRELRNWIERAVIIKGAGIIEVQDLHGGNREIFGHATATEISWPTWTLEQLDTEYIKHVLKECRGNRTAAADRLGISRVTLWRRLKELGMEE